MCVFWVCGLCVLVCARIWCLPTGTNTHTTLIRYTIWIYPEDKRMHIYDFMMPTQSYTATPWQKNAILYVYDSQLWKILLFNVCNWSCSAFGASFSWLTGARAPGASFICLEIPAWLSRGPSWCEVRDTWWHTWIWWTWCFGNLRRKRGRHTRLVIYMFKTRTAFRY